jgi:Caspase domain.
MRVNLTLLLFLLSGTSVFSQDTANKKTLRPVTAEEKLFTQGNNYAIVIGVSNYLDGRKIPQLEYAHTDDERFYNFLLKGYSGKTDPNNIQHFIQKDASFRKIFTAITMWLDSLAPQLQKGDALYIFYSGHGVASNEAKSQQYLCYDTKVKDSP